MTVHWGGKHQFKQTNKLFLNAPASNWITFPKGEKSHRHPNMTINDLDVRQQKQANSLKCKMT